MFSFIENFISFLGYLLTIILFIFSINPLQKTNIITIDLSTIYPKYCNVDTLKKYSQNEIFSKKIDLNNNLNLSIPIDQIENIINRINSVSNYVGKLSHLEIQNCIVNNQDLDSIILDAKNYFKAKSNLFNISDTNEYFITVNQIPILSIANIRIRGNSLIAISNLCYGSVINKEIYLFIWNELKETNFSSFKVETTLFKFKFKNVEDINLYQKSIQNIINSIHYIKQTINSCRNE